MKIITSHILYSKNMNLYHKTLQQEYNKQKKTTTYIYLLKW